MRKIGLAAPKIAEKLFKLTDGWPKRVGDQLFVVEDNYTKRFLHKPDHLFAYIGRRLQSGLRNCTQWADCGEDKVKKSEFLAHLQQDAEAFASVEAFPHYPPFEDVYYAHPEPRGGDGKALKRLLAFFNPATEVDADLIQAMFMTVLWGGPLGQRPAFLIESVAEDPDGGRGVGKTTLCHVVGQLVGGVFEVDANEDIGKIRTRLLSPDGLAYRVGLVDNVKTLRFSSADFESLITASHVSGHAMYVGNSTRPNHLTWMITLNRANLSRDLAQRCIPIRLLRPDFCAEWHTELTTFVNERRLELIGDLIAELGRDVGPFRARTRWAVWEKDVLARVNNPQVAQKLILERQAALDDDSEERDLAREALIDGLKSRGHNPKTECIFITSKQAAELLNEGLNERFTTSKATKYLKNQGIPELRKSNRASAKGWMWQGSDAEPDTPSVRLRDREK